MKFIHLGDLHIGKSLKDFSLIEDQRFILDQILGQVKKQEADAVLIAGDVYDKTIPSEQAVELLDYFISRLAGMDVKTFIISGNHDSDERLNFGSSLFKAKGVYISAKYNGTLYKYEAEDEYGDINIYMLPFVKASQVKQFFPDDDIDSYDEAVRAVIRHAGIDTSKRNILVAHQFVAGRGKDPVLAGSESPSVQNVGLVEKVGADCFEDFDYVALGHIHCAQAVGREETRYSGSMLKYSLSEVNSDKSFPVVTVGKKGDVSIELVPLVPLRDMRHLKGSMNQLLNKDNIKSPDDFIYVTLTDEDVINDAMAAFQAYYPHTVKIDYDNPHTRDIGQVDFSQVTEGRTFSELFSDFFSSMYNRDISEEEKAVINEVAKEAGVADETY